MKRIIRFFIAKLYPFAKSILYFLTPRGKGVKVLVFHKNKLLLIRNTYRKGWTFPGGGVKRNENYKQTAVREVYEEVAIKVSNLRNHGLFTLDSCKSGKTVVFSCRTKTPNFKIDNFEIEKAMWVNIKEISHFHLLPVAMQSAKVLKLL